MQRCESFSFVGYVCCNLLPPPSMAVSCAPGSWVGLFLSVASTNVIRSLLSTGKMPELSMIRRDHWFQYRDKYLLCLVCAPPLPPPSGLGGEAWPSLSFLPGWLMAIFVHHGPLAEVQGLPCPEGQRVGWRGMGDVFTWERIACTDKLSGQGQALY